jgi:hypothetical protein
LLTGQIETGHFVMAVTAAGATACHICLIWRRGDKLMSKHQTNTINTSATSKQVREPTDRQLTADELEHVTGGQEGNLYVGETISGRRIQK